MPTVPTYGDRKVAVQAAPRVQQQAVSAGFGQDVGRAAQGFGADIARVAEIEDKRLAQLDEAEVMELDTKASDWEREALRGDNGFLRQQGRNALSSKPTLLENFEAQQRQAMERAQGPRQRQLLAGVQAQRRARFLDQVETHTTTETENYWDQSFTARTTALQQEAAAETDDANRLPLLMALRDQYVEYGARKGWDADQIRTAQIEGFTTLHAASVNRILEEGDPHAAQAYIDQWAPQIAPEKLTQLKGVVRGQVDEFDANEYWNGPAGRPASLPTVPGPASSVPDAGGVTPSFTLRPPVSGTVTVSSGFGPRRRPTAGASANHGGVDYAVPAFTPVAAAGPGVVKFAGQQNGYGNIVIIDHGGGYETAYAHLGRINVEQGQRVDGGAGIALSGGAAGMAGAGTSTGAHLHFETRHNGTAVDPRSELGDQLPGGATRAAGRPTAPAQVETLEDVFDKARTAAGGDWRRQAAFEQAGTARYSRDRQIEADRERLASDAVSPYLPGGASAAASYDAIPLRIRQGLSPQQDTQIRNVFINEAKGGVATNPEVQNSLLDLAYYDAATFNSLDLNTYADHLSRSDLDQLRQKQRTTRTATPPANSPAEVALQGTDTILNRFLNRAGYDTGENAKPEDVRARVQLRARALGGVEAWMAAHPGQTPTQEQILGMVSTLSRQVTTQRDGREVRVRAFEAPDGAAVVTVIPNRDRRDVDRRLREAGLEITGTNRGLVYRRGLADGIYQPPETRDATR